MAEYNAKVRGMRPDIFRWGLILLVILGITLLRAAPLVHYAYGGIDEHHIIRFALGFIDFDLNPGWFAYHPLPMYVLSGVYLAMYYVSLLFGLVGSKAEFAAQLFSGDALFFVPARLLFALVHTSGCVLLAWLIHSRFHSRLGAVVFLGMALLLPDSVGAALVARTDTFVFLFLCLTVYFACFAEKRLIAVVLLALSCAAAFAAKIPGIVLLPVALGVLAVDAYRGVYPWRYLGFVAVLFPLFCFVLNPFMVLDFETYRPVILQAFERATGEVAHVGKVYRDTFFAKFFNLLRTVVDQVGILPLVLTGVTGVVALLQKRALLLGPLVFVGAYTAVFATSKTLDVYLLRPVYTVFRFFAVILIVEFSRSAGVKKWAEQLCGSWAKTVRKGLSGGRAGLLLVLGIFLLFHAHGLARYYHELTDTREDTRILATRWIEKNLPVDSLIYLEGSVQFHLPNLVSLAPNHAWDSTNYIKPENALINQSFKRYHREALAQGRGRKAVVLKMRMREYRTQGLNLQAGQYIVITPAVYARYYTPAVSEKFPELAGQARAFYDFIHGQEEVAVFEGRGPRLEIYQLLQPLQGKT